MSHAAQPDRCVDIWFDVICPWCWLAKRRFDRALAAFEHSAHITVRYHSFRLMAGMSAMSIDMMLAHRLGSAEKVAAVHRQVEAAAAADGLSLTLSGTLIGDTIDAHRLIHAAAARGLGEIMIERFYRAYFVEHATMFERPVLTRLAGEAGLDPAFAEAVLNGTLHREQVMADQRAVAALGATGAPFYLFNGKLRLSGAQPQAEFSKALSLAFDEVVPAREALPAAGCGQPF